MQKCPKCGSFRVEVYAGGYAGIIYRCLDCGYIGPLVIDVKPDLRYFKDVWGVDAEKVVLSLRNWIVENGVERSGFDAESMRVIDRDKAYSTVDLWLKSKPEVVPRDTLGKISGGGVLNILLRNPARKLLINMLLDYLS